MYIVFFMSVIFWIVGVAGKEGIEPSWHSPMAMIRCMGSSAASFRFPRKAGDVSRPVSLDGGIKYRKVTITIKS